MAKNYTDPNETPPTLERTTTMDFANLYATYATATVLTIAAISMVWAIGSCFVLKAFIKFTK